MNTVIDIQPEVRAYLRLMGKTDLVIYRTTEGSC